MGSVFVCGSSRKSSNNDVSEPDKGKSKSKNRTKVPAASVTTTNLHSPKTIVDNNLKTSNTGTNDIHAVLTNTTDNIEPELPPVLKSSGWAPVRPVSETTPNSDSTHDNARKTRTVSGSNSTHLPTVPETTNNISSSRENVDDDLKIEKPDAALGHSAPSSTTDKNESEIPVTSELNNTQLASEPVTTTDISSSLETPDNKLKAETDAIDGVSSPNDTTDKDKTETPSAASELNTAESADKPETTENAPASQENDNNNAEPQKLEEADEKKASNDTTEKDEPEIPPVAPELNNTEVADTPEATANKSPSKEDVNDNSDAQKTEVKNE